MQVNVEGGDRDTITKEPSQKLKNLFDLHRTAVVNNLHVLARIFAQATEQSVSGY